MVLVSHQPEWETKQNTTKKKTQIFSYIRYEVENLEDYSLVMGYNNSQLNAALVLICYDILDGKKAQ